MNLIMQQSCSPVVLITGATSGIGRQLTLDYLAQGAEVIAMGRNVNQLIDLQQQGADTLCCELTHAGSVETCCQQIAQQYGRIDVLILNAGICEYVEDGQLDVEVLAQTLDVNVIAPTRLLQLLMPLLAKSTDARVALISSAAVYLPFVGAEFYGASKAALQYMGHVLRNSLAPQQIQLSTVQLGFIDTPLTKKNTFAMPMLATTEAASKAIRQGLNKRRAEIHFPKVFCGLLRLLHKLPLSFRLAMAAKLAKSPSAQQTKFHTTNKDLSSQ